MSDSRADVEELGDEARITALRCGESQGLVVVQSLQSRSREFIWRECTDVRLDMKVAEGFRRGLAIGGQETFCVDDVTNTSIRCHDFFQQGHGQLRS